MSRVSTDFSLTVRPYRAEDESRVLELLAASLGGGPGGRRLPELFRWKHMENPFGPSYMLVGEADGRIVGLRAFMRWRFRAGEQVLRAVRAVDTATHPDYQGRGVFTRLTRRAVEALQNDTDLVFNTPNEKSLPGYLKMGWGLAGRVPVSVRVRRPVKFAMGLRSRRDTEDGGKAGPPVAATLAVDILTDAHRVASLLEESASPEPRLGTPRDIEYLRWRYGLPALLDYRAIAEERGGHLRGVAFFRVRPRGRLWESTVAELIVAPGDRQTSRRLLRDVIRAARVDHLTCHFPSKSAAARAAAASGFLPLPGGVTLVVRPLRTGLEPDPGDLRSWALSLGDLEVF